MAILVQAYFFIEACYVPFWGCFRHNFAENDPQDLKMVQTDASHNSRTQSVIKKQLLNENIENIMAILAPRSLQILGC
jgi:hypothetical protein